LLAEDDTTLGALVAGWLQADGHEVVAVDNGYDALTEAASAEFDLFLLDVMIPGVTGDVVARQVRTRQPGARVVHITGAYGLERAGETPVLRKPFTHEELLETVRRELAVDDR
jgi:DNA-binding response OmpR family regulator